MEDERRSNSSKWNKKRKIVEKREKNKNFVSHHSPTRKWKVSVQLYTQNSQLSKTSKSSPNFQRVIKSRKSQKSHSSQGESQSSKKNWKFSQEQIQGEKSDGYLHHWETRREDTKAGMLPENRANPLSYSSSSSQTSLSPFFKPTAEMRVHRQRRKKQYTKNGV